MEIYRNEEYENIAERLVRTVPELAYLSAAPVTFAVVSSLKEKKQPGGRIFGECRRVSPLYSWTCPFDFFIVIYEPNIAGFTDKQLEILIEHELRHIGIDEDGNEPKFYIVPHDVEEFDSILDKYGAHWQVRDV